MPRRHLVLAILLTAAALATTAAHGQPREAARALAEKVCRFGTMTQKDSFFEPLGLGAPLMVIVEPPDAGVAVSAGTCTGAAPRADAPFLGLRRLVEATAPGASAYRDYFILSDSGELLDGIRYDLRTHILIRIDTAEPRWREDVRELEAYWLR